MEEKLVAHDTSLSAIRKLLETGMRMLVNMGQKVDALIDSQSRLYGTVQGLAEGVDGIADKMEQLAEAQRRTEDSLKRFIDRIGNGHRS